jgi:hypothetical protein
MDQEPNDGLPASWITGGHRMERDAEPLPPSSRRRPPWSVRLAPWESRPRSVDDLTDAEGPPAHMRWASLLPATDGVDTGRAAVPAPLIERDRPLKCVSTEYDHLAAALK